MSKPTKSQARLLDVNGVAELLGVSVGWVYKRTHTDEIPRLYLSNGMVRFDPREVDEWIKAMPRRRKKRALPRGKED